MWRAKLVADDIHRLLFAARFKGGPGIAEQLWLISPQHSAIAALAEYIG
jgi:hypothetical protein